MSKRMRIRYDADYLKKSVDLIEITLKSLGFVTMVRELTILDNFYEYYLEVAVGTNLEELEKQDRMLALALASPTGRVYWQIPVPGRTGVGLKVPKPTRKYFERTKRESLERTKLEAEMRWKNNNLRNKIALIFYLLGQANYYIADKILGEDKSNK